jgi:hypothetical protein
LTGDQVHHFKRDRCGRERSYFRMVVSWSDFNHVGSHQIQSLQTANDSDKFTTRDTRDLGRSGAGRMCRIQYIDINRQV